MKKNYSMRIASMLLVLVLLTTCVISGTFAKYVTSDDVADEARVARWGVTVVCDDADLFETEYDATVKSSDTMKVVAPGTTDTFATFAVDGTPEVKVKVSYEATVTLSGWAITGDDFYCPLYVTVNSTELYGEDYESAALFKKAIEDVIKAYSKEYGPLTNLTDKADDDLKISWSWLYEAKAGDTKQTDAKDTLLGDTSSTIKFDVTCTVTQVD